MPRSITTSALRNGVAFLLTLGLSTAGFAATATSRANAETATATQPPAETHVLPPLVIERDGGHTAPGGSPRDGSPAPLPDASPAPALPVPGDRLGLHYTAEELAMWRQRAVKGPFKDSGDVSSHSPGDWDRISDQAGSFSTGMSVYNGDKGITKAPSSGEKVLAAGVKALVNDDASLGRDVLSWVTKQASHSGVDFCDRGDWPTGGYRWSSHPYMDIAPHVTKALFAYDYTKQWATATQTKTITEWASCYAGFVNGNLTEEAKDFWVDRSGDSFAMTGYAKETSSSWKTPTGDTEPRVAVYLYNNRAATQVRAMHVAAVLGGNDSARRSAQRYVKEFVVAAIYADGQMVDAYREFKGSSHEGGIRYGLNALGHMTTIADIEARLGNTGLYDFTTTAGPGMASDGKTAKSLRFGWESSAKLVTGERKLKGENGWALDGVREDGERYAEWIFAAQAASYYRSPLLIKATGMFGSFPDDYPGNGANSPYQGEQGVYPGPLFMFAQPDSDVNPYPTRR